MEKVYQFVSMKQTTYLTKEEVLKLKLRGFNGNKSQRFELQGEPMVVGFLGPMWNGYDKEGRAVIRYETQSYYMSMD
jgi:hypothetical protein